MYTEKDIMVYKDSQPWGERVLVFSPHPDDETLGVGGIISGHREHDDPVKVVVLTDGSKGGNKEERKKEAYEAMAILGVKDIEFLNIPDRELALEDKIIEIVDKIVQDYKPTLIYTPSPTEGHPDHKASAHIIWEGANRFNWNIKLAFYEVGVSIKPNTLVDITPWIKKKEMAINAYKSQMKQNPLGEKILGLNRFRSLTLPPPSQYAEALWVLLPHEIKSNTFSSLYLSLFHEQEIDMVKKKPLVSVIIRTKNRPNLLYEALKSLTMQTYKNFEAVVVNDGGEDISKILDEMRRNIIINEVVHTKSKGRGAALNNGIKAAKGELIAYLDDDDLYYPDHLSTLVSLLINTEYRVAYADAYSGFYKFDDKKKRYELDFRTLLFSSDFDKDTLLFENYIPLNSVMHYKSCLEHVGGFDTTLEIFEDWDFLIKLSRDYTFYHIPKVTAEYRIREKGSNITTSPFEQQRVAHFREIIYKRYESLRKEAALKAYDKISKRYFGEARNRYHLQVRIDELTEAIKKNIEEKKKLYKDLDNLYSQMQKKNEEIVELKAKIGQLETDNINLKRAVDEYYNSIQRIYNRLPIKILRRLKKAILALKGR